MIQIGAVTLTNDVIVEGLKSSNSTTSVVENTIGGEAYVVSKSRVDMPVITFASDEDFGWQTADIVDDLIELEQAGGIYTVSVNATTFSAVFTGGLSAEKVLRTMPDGNAKDYYKVTFSMIKVS